MKNKLRIINNVKIIEEQDKSYVIKKRNKDLDNLFSYLKSRNFDNYPSVILKEEDNYRFEQLEEYYIPIEQKQNDIIMLMSSLHNKTTYYKTVGKDKFDSIYEKLNENILYIEEYYNNIIEEIEKEVYPSPSHYLISLNYSKIKSAIDYCKKELDKWYDLVKNKTKQRVCVVHNNLELNHFIKNYKSYFISWDKYIIDTPIWDLYNFFVINDIDNYKELVELYETEYKLNEDEKILLFILLSIPKKHEYSNNEYDNVNKVSIFLKKLYKTNDLIMPYYSINNKEETKE